MSVIFITLEKNKGKTWIELATEAHRNTCPIADLLSTDRAYDWCVCPKDEGDKVHAILSGSDEWQCCGYEEYAIDLPNNLLAGIIAHEIANDYEAFLETPRQWLDVLSKTKSIETLLILENS